MSDDWNNLVANQTTRTLWFFADSDPEEIRREQEQRLNSEDQKAFRRWLWANAVVGAILRTGLIAFASKFPGDGSTAQNATIHTQAKLP